LLDGEALGCCFDDKITSCQRFAVEGTGDTRPGSVGIRLSEFALGDFAREILFYRAQAAIERRLFHLRQGYGKAAAGKDMGDAVAHGACADYAYAPDLGHARYSP
jgi:hypothetical protein